ncbi:MAG: HD-GYP domain-containing protein [Actinomycetota bacterium]|nr:HD domain-containing protein [Actinomycetota bacterium]
MAVASVVVVVGELLEVDLRGGRSTPVSSGIIFSLFVVIHPSSFVLLTILPAFAIGVAVKGRRVGFGPRFRSTSRRLLAVSVALGAYSLMVRGIPFPPGYIGKGLPLLHVAAMALAGWLELLIDTGTSAVFIARAMKIPAFPVWKGQLRERVSLQAALISVGALMALAYGPIPGHEILREATFGLFLFPLLAARLAFKRYASIHTTYVQTVRALSKVPELAGYAPEGHSIRVADLSTHMARDRGLSDHEVQEVEFAALLHDVGRVSLDDPGEVPQSVAGTDMAARVAEASAAVAGKASYMENVARIVRASESKPGENSPLASKIIKVANDYVELTEAGGPGLKSSAALSQLSRDAKADYDPGVIEALRRVLEHRGVLSED